MIRFTLPSIGTMIYTSIYSVVDGFFVSNFAGKTPFAAINLIIPFLMILSTVGFMFGTGGSAIVAKTFGEGDREKGNQYFSLFVYVAAALGFLLAVLGIAFMRPIAVVLLLPMIWEIDGVWISIVVAEFMAVVFSGIFLIVKRKKYHY